AAVGEQRALHVHQLRAIAGEKAADGNDVPDLGGVLAPPRPIQGAWRSALDRPVLGAAARAGDVDVEINVRVGPLDSRDAALERDRLVGVVLRGKRMMRRERQAGGQDCERYQESCDRALHITLPANRVRVAVAYPNS